MNIYRFTRNPTTRRLIELLLAARALLFVGNRYSCPCCGWSLRAFTQGGISLKVRHQGYCPRCNSKARHRRNWLYLKQNTGLFLERLRLFHVSPRYCLSERFRTMPNINYVGANLHDSPNICHLLDLATTPIRSNTFDAIICIHVLEHIKDDYKAMRELFRVLKPGGWALITVPIHLDQPTYEDLTITTPEERERAFGERQHFRLYGYDLVDRLQACGFQVQLDLGQDVAHQTRERYGLRDDENVFYCTKPEAAQVAGEYLELHARPVHL